MTKHSSRLPNDVKTFKHSTSFFKSTNPPSSHHQKSKKIKKANQSPLQSTQGHLTNSDSEVISLKPIYKQPAESKYFALILIQDLVKLYQLDVYAYCQMLEIMREVQFEGYSDVSLKVAVTIFHLCSKFQSTYFPKLTELLQWSGYIVPRKAVIQCQQKILKIIDYQMPTHESQEIDYIKHLCWQMQQEIFQFQQ